MAGCSVSRCWPRVLRELACLTSAGLHAGASNAIVAGSTALNVGSATIKNDAKAPLAMVATLASAPGALVLWDGTAKRTRHMTRGPTGRL
jgi:hypothetical protein